MSYVNSNKIAKNLLEKKFLKEMQCAELNPLMQQSQYKTYGFYFASTLSSLFSNLA